MKRYINPTHASQIHRDLNFQYFVFFKCKKGLRRSSIENPSLSMRVRLKSSTTVCLPNDSCSFETNDNDLWRNELIEGKERLTKMAAEINPFLRHVSKEQGTVSITRSETEPLRWILFSFRFHFNSFSSFIVLLVGRRIEPSFLTGLKMSEKPMRIFFFCICVPMRN